MKVAIHQPHLFPWLGYLNKINNADLFVLLDEVQLEKGSQMIRNRVLDTQGEIKYLTISADTKDYLTRPYKCILTKDVPIWTNRQYEAIKNYYRMAPYYDEIMPILESFWKNEYSTVCEWTCESIMLTTRLLGITTPLIYQSTIDYDRNGKKSDLVLNICNAVGADVYYSGRGGSVNYLNQEDFASQNIGIEFQNYEHPIYKQCNGETMIAGLSVLDALFNCGIERTKQFVL